MPAVQPAPAMQRRHSSASSSDAGSDLQGLNSSHTSQENIALIPTRMTKVATSKPAANPLQFVKVGPCDLSRHAQEQLKKVEEVKKVKPEKRDEAEDWQSNLDNWKCSRRKRQEHIIERVVEVKKLELEEHDRNRRRSKTFSEMLEERNVKGRKTSLPVYQDDDNDLSDLGLSTSKATEDDSVFHKEFTESESNCNGHSNGENGTLPNGHSKNELRESSSEQEEYTYERAIQNYVNFTESRVLGKTQTKLQPENQKVANGFSKKSSPPVPAKPRRGSCKIEEKLSELEQIKKKSMSTNDLTEGSKRSLSVPKVDILKRREMFEKSQEETSNAKNRLSGDMSKSIRERLSSLGKSSEDFHSNKKNKKISSDISVKDRLSNIEKLNSVDNPAPRANGNENIPSSQTLKQRLSTLQNSTSSEAKKIHLQPNLTKDLVGFKEPVIKKSKDDKYKSLKKTESNQKNCLNNSVPVNNEILTIPNNDVTKEENLIAIEDTRENSLISPVEDIYESKRQQHYRHRSLDSLDVDSTDGLGNDTFERVQSLEDLDFCRNYPASSVSGDTDREDSGIHTADVSSSVSQADDCDLHLDPAEFNQQPTILEEINKNIDSHTSTLMSKQINKLNVSEMLLKLPIEVVPDEVEVVENSSSFLKLPLRIDCDQLPIILESPSEPIPPITISDISNPETAIFPHELSESSPLIISSQTNVNSNLERVSNSLIQSSDINKNLTADDCKLTLVNGGGEKPVVNSMSVHITPNSLTTLPVELSSAEVLHDSKSGAMEICHKIDLSGLTSSLPANATIEAQCTLEPQEKLVTGSAGAASHQLTALTVDVRSKPDLNLPLLPSSIYTTDNSQVIENIETMFPLSPSTLEPPKEKPPPPPTEISDDDDTSTNNKSVSLRRLDSTKRIKKEIRQKRSSFLGIEGSLDDNYLEPELELVRRPPDITSFLAEEKRLEQLLYRQSICSESESRDSGVELEKHNDDLTWPTVHHSRDNSETYANTSTTSEEEEIVKKEREIIEILEREEINRYSSSSAQDKANIGEKLAERLRELEAEKSRLEWEREEEMSRRKAEEHARVEHQSRIQARERELCKQEKTQDVQEMDIDTELLMVERERLEAEQASLARQRDLMLQQQYHNRSLTDVRLAECYPECHRRSMQDLRTDIPQRRPAVELPAPAVDNRRSMPDLSLQPRRPPPPIPPAKPLLIPRTQDKRLSNPQQMTRQTLQALSAAPKTRLNDNWLQAKRKPNNYQQHWLIQEAEQRRIVEHHQRQAVGSGNVARRPVPPPTQQVRSNGAGQYINWQPEKRQDKPLPDAIIQTLTQRVQNRLQATHVPADSNNNRRRNEQIPVTLESQEKMLSVSGKKKCSHCGDELGRGAAMIIESLRLFYHIDCFKCCVCCVQLGDGLMGTDVRVRNNKLHCHNCYSSDDGVKFSCV